MSDWFLPGYLNAWRTLGITEFNNTTQVGFSSTNGLVGPPAGQDEIDYS